MTPNDYRHTTARSAEREQRPSTAVIESVADAKNVEPVELPPLYERIDPDALDEFVGGDRDDPRQVSFEYAGYRVTVEGNGTVTVNGDE